MTSPMPPGQPYAQHYAQQPQQPFGFPEPKGHHLGVLNTPSWDRCLVTS